MFGPSYAESLELIAASCGVTVVILEPCQQVLDGGQLQKDWTKPFGASYKAEEMLLAICGKQRFEFY